MTQLPARDTPSLGRSVYLNCARCSLWMTVEPGRLAFPCCPRCHARSRILILPTTSALPREQLSAAGRAPEGDSSTARPSADLRSPWRLRGLRV